VEQTEYNLARSKAFTWEECANKTIKAYQTILD